MPLVLFLSATYHLERPLARDAVRDVVNEFVSGEIRGTLRIGAIDELSLSRIVARELQLFDPHGEVVAEGETVVLVPDLGAALGGTLRFASAHLQHGKVRLLEGRDRLPTFIEAFEPSRPSTSEGPGLHAIVDGMRLTDVVLEGEVLGLRGIRAERLEAQGRLEAKGPVVIQVFGATADIVAPFPFPARLDSVTGRISTDLREGVNLLARAHTDTDDVTARVRYLLPPEAGDEGEGKLDLRIRLDPAEARRLAEMGFEWAEVLDGTVRGHVRLHGPPESLALRASIETEGGPVQLEGAIGDRVDVVAHTSGLDLPKIVRDAPPIAVQGRAELHVDADEAEPPRARIELEPFVYEGQPIPKLVVEGTLRDSAFEVQSVAAPGTPGRIAANGRVGYDGSLDLRVQANIPAIARQPNLRAAIPGAEAGLFADLHIVRKPRAREEGKLGALDFRGSIELRNVRYGVLTADWLRIRGQARGDLERPSADLRLEGRGVRVNGYPLGTADVQLRGGPTQYLATGRFAAPGDRRIQFEASIEASRDRYALTSPSLEFAVGDLLWRGAVGEVTVASNGDVSWSAVRLANGSQRLETEGTYRTNGTDRIEASLQDFDLTALRAVFGDAVPPVEGRADAHVQIEGTLERPTILVQGSLLDGRHGALDKADLVYAVSYDDGQLAVDTQLDLGTRGKLMIVATGLLDPTIADPMEALLGGVYEVEVAVADLRLDALRKITNYAIPPMAGRIAGQVKISGPPEVPSFEGSLSIPELVFGDWPLIKLRTEFRYDTGALVARVETEDEHGELAEFEGSVLLDLVHLVRSPHEAIAVLEAVPWRVALRVPPRPFEHWPEPLRALLPPSLDPLSVSLSGTLAGGAFQTHGDLVANFDWREDLSNRPCGTRGQPRALLTARLSNGETKATFTAFLHNRAALRVEASAPTPVDAWLETGDMPSLPPLAITARFRDLLLDEVPAICEWAAGSVSGSLSARNLFSNEPLVFGEAKSDALRIRRFRGRPERGRWLTSAETPPMAAQLKITGQKDVIGAVAETRFPNGGIARIHAEGRTPFGAEHLLPSFGDDSEHSVEVRLEEVPLAFLLAGFSNIRNPEGRVTGRLASRGSGAKPELSGRLQVRDGHFEVMPMGQQFGRVRGDVRVEPERITLEHLEASEEDGNIELSGAIDLEGFTPIGGKVELTAKTFPIRREGSVLAQMTGAAQIRAEVGEHSTEAEVQIHELSVKLPDDLGRTLQELERHPDIRLTGDEAMAIDFSAAYPIRVRVDASRAVWVRRTDFAARVRMDLRVVYVDPEYWVTGWVDLERGYFEVFGKRFEVERGRLNFDGSSDLDPELNLVAVHELRGRPGVTVSVTVTGRLSRPRVEFASSAAECRERSDIVSLLVSGRCARSDTSREREAAGQAVDFMVGIIAGVLTVSAREQLGNILPVIAIERGGGGRTRFRAGFQADSAIPKFLRNVVRGAYVEGFFTTRSTAQDYTQATSQSVHNRGGGVLLELSFPHSIVGRGAYSPPDNWSLDLTWEP